MENYLKSWGAYSNKNTSPRSTLTFQGGGTQKLCLLAILVHPYPKRSQDFNAIENAWGDLRERLNETQPRQLESRNDFIKRLNDAVSWMNKHRKDRLWYLSTNQKERADECLNQEPPGGRTKW